MADQRLTDKGAMVSIDDADLIHIVDVSDTSSNAAGTSKKSLWSLIKSTLKTYFDTLYKDESLSFACSDEDTDLAVATSVLTFRMPFAMTLTAVRASVKTAPTGSVLTVDINQSGSTILTDKIEIDAGEKTSTTATNPPIILTPNLTDDAEITIDIDTIGSTIAGTGLKVTLIGTRT